MWNPAHIVNIEMLIRAYSLIINKINRSLYIIWLLEEITNNSNKYLLELFISSNNQVMFKLLFILFINIEIYSFLQIVENVTCGCLFS